MTDLPVVAIIGRPNVGKSTLFNRLVGKKLALVDDQPGVTRDRREGEGRLGPIRMRVIDTAGLEDREEEALETRMLEQTTHAVEDADFVFFVMDTRAGVTPDDEFFARWLRRFDTPVILLANKSEGNVGLAAAMEAYSLGFGDPIPVSGEHGEGLAELIEVLDERVPEFVLRQEEERKSRKQRRQEEAEEEVALQGRMDDARKAAEEAGEIFDESVFLEEDSEEETDVEALNAQSVSIAIVGRPNAGKSTLINHMLGEDRLLTGPEAGITRDSIAVPFEWRGREIKLVDTAGMRKRARVTDKIEKLAVADGLRALNYAQIVVLLTDAENPLEKQDRVIASRVIHEGRALVIGVNKWDKVKNKQQVMRQVQDCIEKALPEVKGVPVIPLSGLTGKGLDELMEAVAEVYLSWNIRIPTSGLNRWLADMLSHHPPPLGRNNRRLKIRYITQAKTRPPTFAMFVNTKEAWPESYLRYLQNDLRRSFNIWATPLRMWLRSGDNPYEHKKKKR